MSNKKNANQKSASTVEIRFSPSFVKKASEVKKVMDQKVMPILEKLDDVVFINVYIDSDYGY